MGKDPLLIVQHVCTTIIIAVMLGRLMAGGEAVTPDLVTIIALAIAVMFESSRRAKTPVSAPRHDG